MYDFELPSDVRRTVRDDLHKKGWLDAVRRVQGSLNTCGSYGVAACAGVLIVSGAVLGLSTLLSSIVDEPTADEAP